MPPDATVIGDCLRDVIARVAVALMLGDVHEAWAAVASDDTTEACSAWDRLRGRHAPSDEDLEQGRQQLLTMLREQMPPGDTA
ncbi:hypothetical protein ACPWT1_20200 [Ramlibacter sp. MMS24-I3-19]|uniref:hypothetical protein n=1 Tax=Ramlibacter sp. MMS24-I3-19 TaxID=3416606 RepID=UPI003D03AC03